MDKQAMYDYVTKYCRNSLKAPSSAVFCPIEEFRVTPQRSTVFTKNQYL